MNLFGGEHVPGGSIIALKKMISAYTLHAMDTVEELDAMIRLTHKKFRETVTEKTIWFKVHAINGDFYFINLVPGEYRNQPPEGDVLVIEIKIEKKDFQLRKELTSFLKSYLPKHEDEKTVINCLKMHMQTAGTPYDMSRFKKGVEEIRALKDKAEVEKIVERLFREHYTAFAIPLDLFSEAMVLLQLNLQFGYFVPPDSFDDPYESTRAFVKTMKEKGLLDPRKFHELASVFYGRAKKHHDNMTRTSSEGKLTEMLRLAAYYYKCALILARCNEAFDVNARLGFTGDIAEEGYACCVSGLNYHDLMFETFDSVAHGILQDLKERKISEFNIISSLSSHSKPMTTRFIAKVFLARAKTMAGGKLYQEGLDALHSLESVDGFDQTAFERHFLLTALVKSYSLKDPEKQKLYATKTAVNMLLQS